LCDNLFLYNDATTYSRQKSEKFGCGIRDGGDRRWLQQFNPDAEYTNEPEFLGRCVIRRFHSARVS
jgi:hypothetical protein